MTEITSKTMPKLTCCLEVIASSQLAFVPELVNDLRMKRLTYTLSLILFLILGVTQVWALPNCPSYQSIYWSNCVGTHTYANGGTYIGEWNGNKMHGQGTYTFARGSNYVGEFKDGIRNGQGTYTFASGENYVGEWKDDKRHGQGTYTFANGSKLVGAFENNKLNGYAITYYADGSINQEGIFKNNKFLYAQKKS